jgi:ABC-type Zn uptake system ZnuABC Zn-binding protein ZnuA
MNYRLLLRLFLLCSLAGANIGCDQAPVTAPDDFMPRTKLKIVTSSVQLAELVSQLGGSAVTVECLVLPKASSHKEEGTPEPPWEPNPFGVKIRASDVFTMQTSHMVVLNGLGLETELEPELAKLRERGVVVVVVGDAIPAEQRLTLPGTSEVDPCYWNSPRMWKYAVAAVTEGLKKLVRPQAAGYFDYRAHPIEERLNRLMTWAESKLNATKPPGRRFLLTSHDTLGYFARDFGLEVRSLYHARDFSPIVQQDTELLAWLEKHGVADLIRDVCAGTELHSDELISKFGVFPTKPVYTIYPDRPGTMQLGKMESFDVGTYEGAIQQLIRVIEHRLGGTRSKTPVTTPEAAAEKKPSDRLELPTAVQK